MTAFFGIDAQHMDEFLERGVACMEKKEGEKGAALLNTFRSIRKEDIVFIKTYSPHGGITVKAAGVAQSDYATENAFGICLPVEWVWKGEKHIEELGEQWPLCGDPLYEEHNIWAQREIMDLMPSRLSLPEEW